MTTLYEEFRVKFNCPDVIDVLFFLFVLIIHKAQRSTNKGLKMYMHEITNYKLLQLYTPGKLVKKNIFFLPGGG
jgi:hypothetical protein